jgi:probable HAF family extracellular repeat protein
VNRTVFQALVCAALLGAAARADAQYSYTKLMVPGSTFTEASGINNLGQVVGTYIDSVGLPHGFIYQNGVYTTIDYPSAAHNYAFGINDAGSVVGSFSEVLPRGPYSATLRENGVWSAYDFPAHETDGRDINANGHIVGIYNDGVGTPDHGFLKIGANYTSIDFPGAPITYVFGLNNATTVTGSFVDNQGQVKGFIYSNGNYTQLVFPNATDTIVTDINNNNMIVGWKVEAGKTIGFTFSNSKYRPVIVPFAGTTATRARGINDGGTVVGSYIGPLDCQSGCSFMATPSASVPPLCEQTLSLTYAAGTLTPRFTLKTSTATTWTPWLILGGVPFRLWSSAISVIDPAATVSIPITMNPKPNSATLVSFLSTVSSGTLCADYAALAP